MAAELDTPLRVTEPRFLIEGDTLRFLVQRVGFQRRPTDVTVVEHSKQVAARAAKFMETQLICEYSVVSPSARNLVAEAYHAGLLHEVILYSCTTYEELCGLVSSTAADMVGNVTPDLRLTPPLRRVDSAYRISQGGIQTQCLALADLLQTAKEVMLLAKADMAEAIEQYREELLGMDEALQATDSLRKYGPLEEQRVRCKRALQQLGRDFDAHVGED